MLTFCKAGIMLGLRIAALFCISRISMGFAVCLWQHLSFSTHLLRFCRTYGTVPYLLLELRLRLNLRYWVTRLTHVALRSTDCHALFLSAARHNYLHSPGGRRILDYLKTLAATDVSPPVRA